MEFSLENSERDLGCSLCADYLPIDHIQGIMEDFVRLKIVGLESIDRGNVKSSIDVETLLEEVLAIFGGDCRSSQLHWPSLVVDPNFLETLNCNSQGFYLFQKSENCCIPPSSLEMYYGPPMTDWVGHLSWMIDDLY